MFGWMDKKSVWRRWWERETKVGDVAGSEAWREKFCIVCGVWVTSRDFKGATGGDSEGVGGIEGEFLVGDKEGGVGATRWVWRKSERQRDSDKRVGGSERDTDAWECGRVPEPLWVELGDGECHSRGSDSGVANNGGAVSECENGGGGGEGGVEGGNVWWVGERVCEKGRVEEDGEGGDGRSQGEKTERESEGVGRDGQIGYARGWLILLHVKLPPSPDMCCFSQKPNFLSVMMTQEFRSTTIIACNNVFF